MAVNWYPLNCLNAILDCTSFSNSTNAIPNKKMIGCYTNYDDDDDNDDVVDDKNEYV